MEFKHYINVGEKCSVKFFYVNDLFQDSKKISCDEPLGEFSRAGNAKFILDLTQYAHA